MGIIGKTKVMIVADVLFCVLWMIILFIYVFTDYKYIRVGVFSYDIDSNSNGLAFEVQNEGKNCEDSIFFDGCSKIEAWHRAGLVYLFLSIFAFFSAIFNLLNVMNSIRKWKFRILRVWYSHYLCPLAYSFAFFLYAYIAGIFDESVSDVLGPDYQAQPGPGLFLMFFCEAFALVSTGIFTFIDLNELEIQSPLLQSYQNI